ncbi:MAG TPA: DNA polymerase I [Gammaproteobacteria bacterium]|nr:DNA polymerase I [Gammaproteobacteria bacterium]
MADFILVDGSYYVFRAFHALPPLSNDRGEPTGVIFGVLNMLRRMIVENPQSQIIVVMDPKGKTFRHENYAEYKANRDATPEEIVFQVPLLLEVIKATGLPVVVQEGFEADDVIATLVRQVAEIDKEVVICSGDKDLAQLVTDKVTLYDSMRQRKMGPGEVFDRYGVKPSQILDYLTLMGDTSDNIPGVPKVGPKTAAKWLSQYQTIESIIEHQDDIKGKVGESFREHVHQLGWVRDLIKLEYHVKEVNLQGIKFLPPDNKALLHWYQRFGFRLWMKEIEDSGDEGVLKVEIIDEPKKWGSLLSRLKKVQQFAFDTETTGLDIHTLTCVGMSFALEKSKGYYLPLAHKEGTQLSFDLIREGLQELFKSQDLSVIGHNLKFDYKVMKSMGIEIHAQLLDTMVAAYVLDSSHTSYSLDNVSKRYLGRSTTSYSDLVPKDQTMADVSIDQAANYAAEDAEVAWCLAKELSVLLENKQLMEVFNAIDTPLIEVLAEMEYMGVRVDSALLMQQSHELASRMDFLEHQVHSFAGKVFNVQSTKQLREVLFGEMALPVIEKTPSGVPSTSESVLHALGKDYEVPKLISEYRQLAKLKSTYADGLVREINTKTQRIHGSFNQAVTITGRLSSTEPNLQNIPVRTQEGRKIRKAFIPRPGYVLLAADYSQIELRIMAHFSKDKGLLEAFYHDQDVHQRTASDVFSVPMNEVTQGQRRRAKAINFGLMYGMSAFGLSKQLNITIDEANVYIKAYFERYPGVKVFMDVSRETARSKGYVETLYGRRMTLAGINDDNRVRRQAAERAAVNAPMQGTAADIIKKAMIKINRDIQHSQDSVNMILQVHDELVFEIHEDVLLAWKASICDSMEQVCHLDVPLKVDVGYGDNWDQAH